MFRSEECRLRMFLYLSPQMSLENSVNTAEYGRMKFCGGQVCYWSKLLWRIKIHYIFSTVVSDFFDTFYPRQECILKKHLDFLSGVLRRNKLNDR